LLEYLIKDTREGLNEGRKKKDEIVKYIFKNKNDEKYYWKSRKKKDIFGNNSMHLAFNIEDEELKYKFINLLIDEEVGDLNKPNIMGLLPHELDHT
jgi:ERCC4-related helicase